MRIHLRANYANFRHTHFTVFINGMNSGTLIMSPDEAANFHQIVALGCKDGIDQFLSTGKWQVKDENSGKT